MPQNPSEEREVRRKSRSTFYKVILVLVLLVLLVVATYTWFSLSTTPRVSDMDIYINAPSGLELAASPDSEEWGQQVAFEDLVTELSTLKPCTWSDENGQFYSVSYGFDGRIAGYTALTDEENANREDGNGYYNVGTVYARSGSEVSVSLSPAAEVEEGVSGSGTYVVGAAVWDSQSLIHNDGGTGAQYALRIGLRISYVDEAGEDVGEESTFYIYEPNSDGHADGSVGYVDTPSMDETETLVPTTRLITQTTSNWTEADPVERTVVMYQMGDFDGDTWLFDLVPGQIAKIDIYIWLEGMDVDCTDAIGHAAQIFANIQFSGDYDKRSGLVPIT